MERRSCKLCLKTFSNGRALGGHMRSHMVTLQPHHHQFPPPPTPPKIQLIGHHHHQHQHQHQHQQQLRDNIETTESASSYSSDDHQAGELELCYGLRENPKKSFRLVDPEFSFAVDASVSASAAAAGSSTVVHVQDRESETESSKNPIRIRRSKRNRKSTSSSSSAAAAAANRFIINNQQKLNQPKLKKPKSSKPIKAHHELLLIHEPEPVSSVSDTTPEEDVARCLMMLSRASWVSKQEQLDEDEDEDEDEKSKSKSKSKSIEEESDDDDDDDDDESLELEELKIVRSRNRAKYQCGTCKKVFRSYQALGGHRASHKKIRGCSNNTSIPRREEVESELGGNAALPNTSNPVIDRKIHECPVCFRVFGSGQALGGHKRTHVSGSSTSTTNVNRASSNSIKFGDNLIDLNLPAPVEDDDYSQIELSAVSDAEFIDPIK